MSAAASPRPRRAADPGEADRLRSRRDNARWSAVVGFLLLFGGSFSAAFVAGGVAMIAYGAVASIVWSARLRKVQGDPWAYDPDLDGPAAPTWAREGRPPAPHEHDGDDAPGAPEGPDGEQAGPRRP